jgi:hypothetical protein
VDITFGEYLRALITGDTDIAPDDRWGYRIAVIEAFRRRGIYPRDVRTLAADALLWTKPTSSRMRDFFAGLIHTLKKDLPMLEWQTTAPREQIDHLNHKSQKVAWRWIKDRLVDHKTGRVRDADLTESMGLAPGAGAPPTVYRSKVDGLPALEIHSVRSARRPTQEGRTIIDLVVEMTQRRRGYLEPEKQKQAEALAPDSPKWKSDEFRADFKVRGGCTLLINSETGEVRYCVVKSIGSDTRLTWQRAFVSGATEPSLRATYSRVVPGARVPEPFALLHRSR